MSAKFGLAAVDPKTYERIVKPSGEYYAQYMQDAAADSC